MRRKSYRDGIPQGGDLLHQQDEERKLAEVCLIPGAIAEVEVEVGVPVQRTRIDQKHLTLKDLERNLQSRKAKGRRYQREKRMQRGIESRYWQFLDNFFLKLHLTMFDCTY